MSNTGPPPESRNTHSFETERLLLELPNESDAEVLFGLVGGPHRREICATLIWDGPEEIYETREWIEKANTLSFEDFGYHWVIRDREGSLSGASGQALGAIGTRPRDNPGRADVGYWLGRPYWGKGVMGEALRALIELGFNELDYYKMEADVHTHNERGIRLVESVGMNREGVIRRAFRKYGELVDTALYGLLREEWAG